MDEDKTKKTITGTDTDKTAKKDAKALSKKDSEKKGFAKFVDSVKGFFTDIRGEFRKIIWPSREQLIKETVIVICTSLIIGLVICGFDGLFSLGYNALINLVF